MALELNLLPTVSKGPSGINAIFCNCLINGSTKKIDSKIKPIVCALKNYDLNSKEKFESK